MQEYYEELWRRLPIDAAPADFALRLRYLLSEVRPQDRALDVGCGAGDFTAELARAAAMVVGVDVAQEALNRALSKHPQLDFRLVQIGSPLPFEDNSFDLVWAGEVIEHVADTARWLSEVRRVLAPAGRLLVSTPNHCRLRVALYGVERFSPPLGDHLHLYTRRSLAELLREFGFGEVNVSAAGGAPTFRPILLGRAVR